MGFTVHTNTFTSNLTKNWVFATNQISLQPNVVFETMNFIGSHYVIFNSQMVTQSGCKGIGIGKF